VRASHATHVRGRRGGFSPYQGGIKDLGRKDARYEFPPFDLWAPCVQENLCEQSGGRCGLFVGVLQVLFVRQPGVYHDAYVFYSSLRDYVNPSVNLGKGKRQIFDTDLL